MGGASTSSGGHTGGAGAQSTVDGQRALNENAARSKCGSRLALSASTTSVYVEKSPGAATATSSAGPAALNAKPVTATFGMASPPVMVTDFTTTSAALRKCTRKDVSLSSRTSTKSTPFHGPPAASLARRSRGWSA